MEDQPQRYGSGNNADEVLTRLAPEATTLIEQCLGERALTVAPEVLGHADRVLSVALFRVVLEKLTAGPLEFDRLVPVLIDRVLEQRESGPLPSLLMSYAWGQRERCERMIDLLRGRAAGPFAAYLLKFCEEERAKLHLGRSQR